MAGLIVKYLVSLPFIVAVTAVSKDGYDLDIVPQPNHPCKGCVAYAPLADLLEAKLCRVVIDASTVIPGRLMLWTRTCGIVQGDSAREIPLSDLRVEVLMVNEDKAKTTWTKATGGSYLPCNAIKVGKEGGVTLYAGRTRVPGNLNEDQQYEAYNIGKVRETNPGFLHFYNSRDRMMSQQSTDFEFLVCPKSKC